MVEHVFLGRRVSFPPTPYHHHPTATAAILFSRNEVEGGLGTMGRLREPLC